MVFFMDTEKEIKKFRAINIIFGILIMLLAILVFVFPTATLAFIIYLIAFILMLGGIIRLINAYADEQLNNAKIITGFAVGLALIIISIVVIIITLLDPTYTISILLILLAIALLIMGIGGFMIGILSKGFELWFRIVLIVIGILTLIFSIIIFLFPTVGAVSLLILISVNLLINGLGRLLSGIVGPETKD